MQKANIKTKKASIRKSVKTVKAQVAKTALQDDLTQKEKLFIEIYGQTNNATEAALRVYNCTPESARVIGARKLAKVSIRERIQERVAEAGVKTNEVIGTIASHLRIDATEAFDVGENVIVDRLRDKGLGHWIRSITIKRYTERIGEELLPAETTRLEFHNSQTAAAQLCKVLGIEKQPGVNPVDEKARFEAAVEYLLKKVPTATREDALEALAARMPEANQFLN